MRVEMLPGLKNVVRFPVERRARPTMELLWEIAPDVREVSLVAETFDMDMPAQDLRDRVDAETAQYILEQFGGVGSIPPAALDELLQPVVAAAIAACHTANDLSLEAAAVREVLARAQAAGGYWLDPLRERAEMLTFRAAEQLLAAHAAAEEAAGVARAVGLARRGEAWTPRDEEAEFEALIRMAG